MEYWNNIKLAKEAFLSQRNFKTEGPTLKCDKISSCLVSSLFSRYIYIVQQVFRNTHCDDGFCHENACFVTTDLETQSSSPKGNITNTLNSAIPEADKNK